MVHQDTVAGGTRLGLKLGEFLNSLVFSGAVSTQDRVDARSIIGTESRNRIVSVAGVYQGKGYTVLITVVGLVNFIFDKVP